MSLMSLYNFFLKMPFLAKCHIIVVTIFYLIQYISPKNIVLNSNCRSIRHCNQHLNVGNDFNEALLTSQLILIFLLIFGLLLLLILLGILKGLIGLICCQSVGMYGLDLLIDLPRPLERYQEKCLCDKDVVYDVGGWPLHPQTLERTVRILSKRTEFCLNLVFFLAYPLAILTFICGFCCCIKNYDENEEGVCFKTINMIKLADCAKGDGCKRDPCIDIYRNDNKELEDTEYVMNVARKSQVSFADDIENCPFN